jgi:hypothetical protein
MTQVFRAALVAFLVIIAIGCGKGGSDSASSSGKGGSEVQVVSREDRQTMTDLQQMGLAYNFYNDAMNAGPSKIDDLAPFVENDQRVLNRVKTGEIVLIWDVRLANKKAGEGLVLGYAKQVPEKGGPVVMGDATVEQMTADQFKKAKKATPTPKKD